jgi:hypothetical protein
MLDELEGAGIEDRREQAKAMGVSLPQIDRLRRALRAAGAPPKAPARQPSPPDDMVQLGVRVPASIAVRLQRHAARRGVSAALLTAVALHDWLAARGVSGPSPLGTGEREKLQL